MAIFTGLLAKEPLFLAQTELNNRLWLGIGAIKELPSCLILSKFRNQGTLT